MGRQQKQWFLKYINEIIWQNNDIDMYARHNGQKSVIAERFIKTLKNKIYKYLTLIQKKMFLLIN